MEGRVVPFAVVGFEGLETELEEEEEEASVSRVEEDEEKEEDEEDEEDEVTAQAVSVDFNSSVQPTDFA